MDGLLGGAVEVAADKDVRAHRQQLLQEAETQVALRVQSHTWKTYQLTTVEERPAAQVARDLQIPISEVYVAKSRVLKMLRETITRLEDF